MLRAPELAGRALDGRYELHALLGEGAFGRVYRGLDRRLGRPVAVKVIKPWWAEDSAWVDRFEREARLLARVSDPGIVQIFDIGHAEEGPYYVAELVDGESLAERLRGGALPVEQARSIAERLCRALASAHREGVVHCDVKPANVLLSASGEVKVGDFGVARLAEGTSQAPTATVAGTPRYMSPEQARGRPTTAATDVYSAGIVLYEMLAGEPPFMHGSPVELGLRHLQDSPPPLPAEIPPDVRAVVERSLAKDPAERYPDAGAMADALHGARAPGSAGDARAGASSAPGTDGHGGTPTPGAPGGDGEALTVARSDAVTVHRGESRTRLLPKAPTADARPPAGARGVHRRRRAAAAIVAAIVVLVTGALVVLLSGSSVAHTTVPELLRLPRGGVEARAQRLHVRPLFSSRHSAAAAGVAVAQAPAPGTRVADGASVRVVLSSGPPPVAVPAVVGAPAATAEARLADGGLRYRVTVVAAPGSAENTVLRQSPAAPGPAPRGSTVALSVAEAPRWRPLTTFSGVDDGHSVPFRILGSRWRVRYSMSFSGTCLLLVVCGGPSAEARNLDTGAGAGGFELGEGETETHTFSGGPGLYRLTVSGGRDSASWSMTVEDYY